MFLLSYRIGRSHQDFFLPHRPFFLRMHFNTAYFTRHLNYPKPFLFNAYIQRPLINNH